MDRIKKLLLIIEEEPLEPFNYYALALEYKKKGAYQEADQQFELLKTEHPNFLATYYHYADLLILMDDPQKALELYSEGIQRAEADGDQHTLSELKNAKLNLEIELDE